MADARDRRPKCRVCGKLMGISVANRYCPVEVAFLLEHEGLSFENVVQYECLEDTRHGYVWQILDATEELLWVI